MGDLVTDLRAQLANELDDLMRGVPVGAELVVPPSAAICDSLELFIPATLRQRHPERRQESLDGIFVARAVKTGPSEIELIGTCILITDQTVTPFLARLGVGDSGSVAVRRLKLGEPGTGPLGISGPPCNARGAQRLLMSLVGRIHEVEWSYAVQDASGSPDERA